MFKSHPFIFCFFIQKQLFLKSCGKTLSDSDIFFSRSFRNFSTFVSNTLKVFKITEAINIASAVHLTPITGQFISSVSARRRHHLRRRETASDRVSSLSHLFRSCRHLTGFIPVPPCRQHNSFHSAFFRSLLYPGRIYPI